MSTEQTEQTEKERKMFGSTIADIIEYAPPLRDHKAVLNYAMGILSDAQEAMERGQAEMSRQFINKAKYLMSETSQSLGSISGC